MVRFIGYDGHQSQQEDDELHEFIKLMQDNKVTRYLEIGLAHGIGFHEVVTSLPKDGTYVGVDLPVDHASGPLIIGQVCRDLTKRGYQPVTIWGNSRSTSVINLVRSLGPYDMVFIDGDHRPEGVKHDWEVYGEMGRIVAFHDIHSDFVPSFGVGKLWKSIKGDYENREITGEAGTQTGMGVGVLWRY